MYLIEKKIRKLSPELQQEVIDFIDFLIERKKKSLTFTGTKRPYGLCNGEIKITEDFQQPLSDEILKEWDLI